MSALEALLARGFAPAMQRDAERADRPLRINPEGRMSLREEEFDALGRPEGVRLLVGPTGEGHPLTFVLLATAYEPGDPAVRKISDVQRKATGRHGYNVTVNIVITRLLGELRPGLATIMERGDGYLVFRFDPDDPDDAPDPDRYQRRAWTAREDALLLADPDATPATVARRLGRSAEAVKKRRNYLADHGGTAPPPRGQGPGLEIRTSAAKRRAEWTELADRGERTARIAEWYGVTPGTIMAGVRQHRQETGAPHSPGATDRRWTSEEDALLLEDPPLLIKEIAEQIDRSTEAVRTRLTALRKQGRTPPDRRHHKGHGGKEQRPDD